MHPRPDHITASMLPALALCPGRWNACKGLPPQPAGPDAESGTRIHAVLASVASACILTEDELQTYDMCCRLRDSEVERVFGSAKHESYNERRLVYQTTGGDFSGQADRVLADDTTCLIIDYKTGHEPVSDATLNWQLAGLVVLQYLCDERTVYESIEASIIQPWCKPQVHSVRYDTKDLDQAVAGIRDLLGKAYAHDAPRNPHPDACKYCRAKTTCPEALAEMKALQVAPSLGKLSDLPNADLAQRLDQCAQVEQVVKAFREEARRRLGEGAELIGWELEEGRRMRKIIDADEAFGWWWERTTDDADKEDFMQFVSVHIGKLEKATKTKVPDHLVEETRTAPMLQRKKE